MVSKKMKIHSIIGSLGMKETEEDKVGEGKQDDFFSSKFTTEDVGEKPLLAPAFIFLYFFF